MKLHCHRRGNWSILIHSKLRQDRPNVDVLMYVELVMLPIPCDVRAKIEGDTLEIMHPKPLLHLVLDVPSQALGFNDMEMSDAQYDYGDNCG
jgi:hypothetical protein